MNTTHWSALLIAALLLLPATSQAQTYRCENGVVGSGDSKAEVIQRCGQPQSQDSYCEPFTQATGVDANGAPLTTVAQCENVDLGTYNPGTGKFLGTLEFRRGRLSGIVDGDRVR